MLSCRVAFVLWIWLLSTSHLVGPILAKASEKESTNKDVKETAQSWKDWAYQRARTVVKRNADTEKDQKGTEAGSISGPSTVTDKLWSYVSGVKSFRQSDAKGNVESVSRDTSATEGTKKKVEGAYEAAKAGVGEGTRQAKEQMEHAAQYTSEAATNLGSKIKDTVGIGGGRDQEL